MKTGKYSGWRECFAGDLGLAVKPFLFSSTAFMVYVFLIRKSCATNSRHLRWAFMPCMAVGTWSSHAGEIRILCSFLSYKPDICFSLLSLWEGYRKEVLIRYNMETIEEENMLEKVRELWTLITQYYEQIAATELYDQIGRLAIADLLQNRWVLFLIACGVGYMLYKKMWRFLVIFAVLAALFWGSGTPYMQEVVVGGELSLSKLLPVIGVTCAGGGFIIYLLFGRS